MTATGRRSARATPPDATAAIVPTAQTITIFGPATRAPFPYYRPPFRGRAHVARGSEVGVVASPTCLRAMEEPLQKSLERYDVLDRIAVGGMAEVFLAKAYGAHGFEKTLAIKRILPELARDPEFEARFIAEAKVAVKLSHANVVQVFDFGRIGESLFIAMEYVDGLDLAALLRKFKDEGRQVPLPAAFHIAIEIVRALDFAHQPQRRPPRRLAVEHPDLARRRGEDRRLRDRGRRAAAPRRRPGPAQGHGQVALHVARAGARRHARHAQRPVLAPRR